MKNSEADKSARKPGKLPPKPKKLLKPAEMVRLHWHKTPKTNEKLK